MAHPLPTGSRSDIVLRFVTRATRHMDENSVVTHEAFSGYAASYPARLPDLSRLRHVDELVLLKPEEGVLELRVAPMAAVEHGTPPRGRVDQGHDPYLWAIRDDSVPLVLESGEAGRHLTRGRAAHTNLTGGEAAHAAGEIWFRDDQSFWISGGSSRYPPRTSAELDAIVVWFAACGYSVASLGWDHEVAAPARFVRGEEVWS
jgi:hypothetical protein